MRRHDEPERAPDPPDLLDGDGVCQGIQAGTALVLRDRDAEPAELTDPAHDLGWESPRPLVLVDDRRHLGDHEIADRVAQEDMLRREVEVHRPEGTTGTARLGHRC